MRVLLLGKVIRKAADYCRTVPKEPGCLIALGAENPSDALATRFAIVRWATSMVMVNMQKGGFATPCHSTHTTLSSKHLVILLNRQLIPILKGVTPRLRWTGSTRRPVLVVVPMIGTVNRRTRRRMSKRHSADCTADVASNTWTTIIVVAFRLFAASFLTTRNATRFSASLILVRQKVNTADYAIAQLGKHGCIRTFLAHDSFLSDCFSLLQFSLSL